VRFGEIPEAAVQEGKEKHVPFIELVKGTNGGDAVHVLVGKEVPHPNMSITSSGRSGTE